MTVLYHYCSTRNFFSILSSRSIWLSSLKLSNDAMEGKLVADIICRLAKRDGFNDHGLVMLRNAVRLLEEVCDGLGFCLSEDGDLLSQWRGYASDATGFSIGFSKEYLSALSEQLRELDKYTFSIMPVKYEPVEQEEGLNPTYIKLKDMFDTGKMTPRFPKLQGLKAGIDYDNELKEFVKIYNSFLAEVTTLIPQLYSLKTKAFQEEQEWRLVSHLYRPDCLECKYRVVDKFIVPYRIFELPKMNVEPFINIKIGPKNLTPVYVVMSFLRDCGYNNVTVSNSSSTYR